MPAWSIYVLRCDGTALYTGITTDVARRFREHCRGGARAARYTRACRTLELVYSREIGARSLALQAEYRLKRLPAASKQHLIRQVPDRDQLLALLDLA